MQGYELKQIEGKNICMEVIKPAPDSSDSQSSLFIGLAVAAVILVGVVSIAATVYCNRKAPVEKSSQGEYSLTL